MGATPIYGIRYQGLGDPPDGPALGQNLAGDVETELARIDAFAALPSAAVSAAAGTATTTSTTYVNYAATSSLAFTKKYEAALTKIEVHLHVTAFVTGTVQSGAQFAVRINGVDYDIARMSFSVAATRQQASGVLHVTGLAAGSSYTAQTRWKRYLGSGTLTTATGDDWYSLLVREVPA